MKPLKSLRWIVHPVSIFVMAQIVWGLLMFIWIQWYLLRGREINQLVQKISLPDHVTGQWVILLEGCVLMAFLLIALYIIFVSQRRLSRLNKMQDMILSSVTHELKTPLASIRLYTETMLVHKLSEEKINSFLKRIVTESERLQKLIDTVLVSVRLETKSNQSKNWERINFSHIIEKSVHKLKERVMETRTLKCHIQKDLFLYGNLEQLCILVDNLLDNAFKYTHAQGHISVELGPGPKKRTMKLMIADNGVGLHKSDLKKIFHKFYRTERHSFHSVKGSGLGLWVCRSIVRDHGGRIYATSQGQTHGSQFYVVFKRLGSFNRG